MNGSVADILDLWARERPDDIALIDRGRPIRIADLAGESRKVAASLSSLGIVKGDRVAIWLPNVPAWIALFVACCRIGAIAVAANTRFRSAEMKVLLRRTRPRAICYWPDFRGINFGGILGDVDPSSRGSLEIAVTYSDGAQPHGRTPVPAACRGVSYRSLAAHRDDAVSPGGREDMCILFSTSGTTSEPKFVAHAQSSIADHAAAVGSRFSWVGSNAVILQILPFCGTFGLSQLMAALTSRRPTVMRERFAAADAARDIESFAISHLCGTNDAIRDIHELMPPEARPRDDGFWAFARFNPGLDNLPADLARRGIRLVGLYGSSEMQALFAAQDPLSGIEDRFLPGGHPVSPQAAVRVREPGTGRLCGPGEPGELEFTGPSMMRGYFEAPEATRDAITEDGFFRSGDIGELRPNGGFIFRSRAGDFLRLNGFLVHPAEIEAYIQAHADVEACQVVEAAAPEGAVAVAFITTNPGGNAAPESLRDWCLSGLARYKVPRYFVQLAEFPVTDSANGVKIKREKLREWATEVVLRGEAAIDQNGRAGHVGASNGWGKGKRL
ncbi:MAG: fatty-acyl-CoA synthase [Rhodospirillaceae bacterium]|nr:fatty-acyl-CoA synthase [Rhodospirillaceae bacterium]